MLEFLKFLQEHSEIVVMTDFYCELTIRSSSKRYLKQLMLLCESIWIAYPKRRGGLKKSHAMRARAKERTKTLMGKMGKLLAVAALANGSKFLAEVRYTKTTFRPFGFLHYVSTV